MCSSVCRLFPQSLICLEECGAAREQLRNLPPTERCKGKEVHAATWILMRASRRCTIIILTKGKGFSASLWLSPTAIFHMSRPRVERAERGVWILGPWWSAAALLFSLSRFDGSQLRQGFTQVADELLSDELSAPCADGQIRARCRKTPPGPTWTLGQSDFGSLPLLINSAIRWFISGRLDRFEEIWGIC